MLDLREDGLVTPRPKRTRASLRPIESQRKEASILKEPRRLRKSPPALACYWRCQPRAPWAPEAMARSQQAGSAVSRRLVQAYTAVCESNVGSLGKLARHILLMRICAV